MRWWPCGALIAALVFLLVVPPAVPRAAKIGAITSNKISTMTSLDQETRVREIVANTLVPEATADHAGGLASVVYIDGHALFFTYGLADQTDRRPVTPDTLFNIASVRKLFEATLVALGTLRGELRLDDPVSKYVTELHGDYIRRVTIGELATHTSGLLLATDHPPWPNESYSQAEFLDVLNMWTPGAGEQPGKQRIYTHAGYVLLQLALERRYGLPIGELIESRILKPLHMTSTLVPERGPGNRAIMTPARMRDVVQGYSDSGLPIGPPGNQQSYYDFSGTGQMFSSARDLGDLSRGLPRRRRDRSATAGRIADDAAGSVPRRPEIRTGDGLGNHRCGRRRRRRQAGRSQQCDRLYGAGAGPQGGRASARQSRRVPARDRPLPRAPGAGAIVGAALPPGPHVQSCRVMKPSKKAVSSR